MTTDASKIEPEAPRPRWKLPKILDIRIARVPYQAPKFRHFKSVYAKYKEAIEFLVETDGSFPIRALSPVLFVGETPVVENEAVKEKVYRFLAFEFDKLEQEAPISLGWPGQPVELRQQTKFRYKLPDGLKKE